MKVFVPALLARMKQGDDTVRPPGFRVCGRYVRPLLNPSMWPQLSSPFECFFVFLGDTAVLLVRLGLKLARTGSALISRFTHPVPVSTSCVPRVRSSLWHWPRALAKTPDDARRCRAPLLLRGFTHAVCWWLRDAWDLLAPTTCSPCRRRCRPAPNPVCALRRVEKHSGERPPLQHGSSREPGDITSRSHPHTCKSFCWQNRHT
jgi:hypothetical protein